MKLTNNSLMESTFDQHCRQSRYRCMSYNV